MSELTERQHPVDGAGDARGRTRKAFFTDTSICIGCKACEVACKQWNGNPADGDLKLLESSYDNTGALGANTWRHVAFVEQSSSRISEAREAGRSLVDLGMPSLGPPPGTGPAGTGSASTAPPDTDEFRWLMSSDVCKHCTNAGCLDVCPTGALFRTEFGTVKVQEDICNGCGTCVAGCPFGVIERRDVGTVSTKSDRSDSRYAQEVPNEGTANKCTFCYDRLVDDQVPACAQTCPTTSIKFGDLPDMVDQARERVSGLRSQGMTDRKSVV